MAKLSYNDIERFDSPIDSSNGLKWSGESVRIYIEKYAEIVRRMSENKYGAVYFDGAESALYAFASVEDKEAWQESHDPGLVIDKTVFSFETEVFKMNVVNKMESQSLFFSTSQEKAEITFGFLSQKKEITASEWVELMEDAVVTVSVDKGGNGEFVDVVIGQRLMYGSDMTVDIKNYIATGTNRVMVQITGTTSGTSGTLLYVANMTTMYLAPSNFSWNVPFVEGKTYNLGGVNIGGAIDKSLFVKVTNEGGYYKLYEKHIGTATYTTNAYFFKDLEFPSAGTGVYNIEMWLDADGLESEHLSYNIICVSSADETTAQLVCISNMTSKAINYADNTLFYYSVYNGGAAKATPHVKITAVVNTNPIVLVDESMVDIDTATKLPYNFHLEVETDEADLQLTALLAFGNEQVRNFVIDNSASYPSTSGASFYINAANRNNSQENKKNIVNEVTKGTVGCDWTNMSFADGTDGWTVDDIGRKCLLVNAGSTATIHYKPLASVGTGKTIEINYKVKNVADYNEPIISICDDPSSPTFRGIRIKPKNITLHSRDKNTADYVQGYNLEDEEYVNLLITIIRSYKTNYGNIAIIYVNGVKKCEFEFENADSWAVDSNIILGNTSSDLCLYTMRVYESAFGFADAQKNYVASLGTSKDKANEAAKISNILDDSFAIDYDKVKGIYNTMVVEMIGGAELPHYGLSKEYAANCNLEVDILNEDEDKPAISGTYLNTPMSGQGTTSMNYFRWNLRTKKTPIRLTAKKNYASSMQSHKIGATGAFNDLHELVVGPNEAEGRVAVYQYPCFGFQKILIEGTTDQYSYEFIGLFTIGPDKSDASIFGYNDASVKNSVISLEGTDHSIKGVGFDYPWDELVYDDDKESICVDRGAEESEAAWEMSQCGNKKSEADKAAYINQEFAPAYKAVYDNSCMIMGTPESIETINADVTSWGLRKDATGRPYQHFEFWLDGEYDIYYLSRKTNTYVKNGVNLLTQLGISEEEISGMTIDEKNNLFIERRLAAFRDVAADYFDINDILFVLVFLFINGASDNFKKNSYPYKMTPLAEGGRWRMRQDDLDTIADIDNQGLSTKSASIELPDFTDETKTAYVFKGEDSVLVQNFVRAFAPEFKAMGRKILAGMYELSDTGTDTIDRLVGFYDKYFWGRAQKYFPRSAYNIDAEYSYEEAWPPYKKGNYVVDVHPLEQSKGDHYEAERDWFVNRVIYCASKFGYGPFAQYNDSSLGVISFRTQLAQDFTLTPSQDLYPTIHSGQSAVLTSRERVKAGEQETLKGAGGANTNVYIKGADLLTDIGDLKTLSVDAANASISVASKRLQRLKIGDENAESVTSNLSSVNMGECPSLMLVDARNLASLTGTFDLSQCPRIREAYFGGTDVRAITLANGSKITRLQLSDVVTQISMQNLKFLDGTGLEKGDLSNVEFFRVENCEKLDAFGMLKELYQSEASALKNIRIIGFVYDGDATDVDMISNLAKDIAFDGSTVDYTGIDSDGNPQPTMLPVIEGTLNVAGSVFQDSAEFVMEKYPNLVLNVTGGYYIRFADRAVGTICATNWGDGIGITEAQAAAVTTIGTKFSGNTEITSFDELEKFTGVTQIASRAFYGCTSLKTISLSNIVALTNGANFKNDSSLSIVVNMPKLTGVVPYGAFERTAITGIENLGEVTTIQGSANVNAGGWDNHAAFRKCTELKFAKLPSTLKEIQYASFAGCTSLESITFDDASQITTIGVGAFYKVPWAGELNFPNLAGTLRYASFQETGITKIINLGKITTIEGVGDSLGPYGSYGSWGAFKNCTSLVSVSFPDSLTTLGYGAFSGCTSLEIDDLILPNLTSIDKNVFYGVKITKISNLGKITKLPTAYQESQNYGSKSVLKEVVLPSTITNIVECSFYKYTALAKVDILWDVITEIGTSAFDGCTSLIIEELSLPNITQIYKYAFRGVTVKRITNLGSTITIIRDGCFYNSPNLTYVNIPAQVTYIYTDAFRYCTSLVAFICNPTTPPTLYSNVFANTPIASGTGYIYVPDESVDAYKSATNWSQYQSIIKPLSEYVEE